MEFYFFLFGRYTKKKAKALFHYRQETRPPLPRRTDNLYKAIVGGHHKNGKCSLGMTSEGQTMFMQGKVSKTRGGHERLRHKNKKEIKRERESRENKKQRTKEK